MRPDLKIQLYADGAVIEEMVAERAKGVVKGFTTNPTLMRKAGVTDYPGFARKVLEAIPDLPISFEVFADEFEEMERQALLIAAWGSTVFVKIPITNTRGESSLPLIRRLTAQGVKLNVTAILSYGQVDALMPALVAGLPSIVSVFAGRVADTGVDPMPLMARCRDRVRSVAGAELLWASTREVLNIHQAEACGCDIITVTPDLLKKLAMAGMDLETLSLDTVKMFRQDALAAGFYL